MAMLTLDVGNSSTTAVKTLVIRKLPANKVNEILTNVTNFHTRASDFSTASTELGLQIAKQHGLVDTKFDGAKKDMEQVRYLRYNIAWSFYYRPGTNTSKVKWVTNLIDKAMKAFAQDSEYAEILRASDLNFYMDYEKQGSAGYLTKTTPNSPNRCHMFMGTDLWASSDNPPTGTGILGNYLYRVKPQGVKDLLELRALGYIFHEFGHMFHQIINPSSYCALGALGIIAQKNSEWGTTAGIEYFVNPTSGRLKGFSEGISGYAQASKLGGYAAERARSPDIIAEVFAGLMLGIKYEAGVMDLYYGLGGFSVPGNMAHKSTSKGLGAFSDIANKITLLDNKARKKSEEEERKYNAKQLKKAKNV